MVKIKKEYIFLITILISGFILRIWGIDFGLPYQFHQDEQIVVNHALAYGSGDFNPHFFAIPPLTSYLLFIIYGIYFILGKLFGMFHTAEDFALSFFKDPSMFYLLGRLFIGVIPGTLCIIFTYRLYKKIFISISGAIFACAIIAFSFLNIADSHYIYTDMLMSLFIILSMLQIMKMYNLPSFRNYLFAGALMALAVAVKYNSAIIIISFCIAHTTIVKEKREKFFNIKLFSSIFTAAAIIFITNPFAILDFKFFLSAMLKQGGAESYTGWLHHFNYSLCESIGLPLSVFGFAGLILILSKDIHKGMVFLSFPFLFYLHLVFFSQRFPRYVLPLMPFFAVGAAYFIFEYLFCKVKYNFFKTIIVLIVFLLFIPLFIKAIKADRLFASSDTRVAAANWIKANLKLTDKIAVDHTFFRPAIIQNEEQLKEKYAVIGKEYALKAIKDKKFKLVLEAQKQTKGYYLYFLSSEPQDQGQFLATLPALPFDMHILKNKGIDYVVINYSDRQTETESFYQNLKDNAELIVSFSPYNDNSVRYSYDTVATTSLSLLSKEIFSRKKTGPALEIYKLNK